MDYEKRTIPCKLCGEPTRYLGTKRCNRCWELEHRIHADPEPARQILAKYDEAGMEIKRLQESVREARREVFARIREKGFVVVPAPMLGSTGFATLVLTAIPDQDAIEREVMG